MRPFTGRCHTCGHDHDAELQHWRDVLDLSKAPPRALPESVLVLAESHKGRADDCGVLARAILAAQEGK